MNKLNKIIILLVVFMFIVPSASFLSSVSNASSTSSNNNTLTVALVSSGPVVTMNPLYPGGQSAILSSQLTGIMYLSLLQQAPNGTLEPQLASSWSVNSNATSFTFNLRPNLKWSDGLPLNASNVAYTFSLFVNSSLLDSFNGFEVGPLIKSMNVINQTTIVFHLKHSFAPFLEYAGLGKVIVPETQFSKVNNLTSFSNSGSPVGDGPYILKDWTPGSSVLRFYANPNFYMGKPKLSVIDVQILSSDSTIPSLLSSKSIDLAQPAPSQLSSLNGIANISTSISPGVSIFGTYFDPACLLMYNNELYPYNVTTVKQALAYAINRTEIVSRGLSGQGSVGNQSQLPISLSSSISPNVPGYKYNPDKAEAMLASVGFKKSSNGYFEFANGTLWQPTILNTGGVESSVASIIVLNLKAAGIDATTETITTGSLVSALEYGNFNMLLLQTSRPPIPSFILGVFASNQTIPTGSAELNYHGWTRWTNTTFINDLDSALKTGNSSQQLQYYYNAEEIAGTQLPLITLAYGNAIWAYSNANVHGWKLARSGYQFPQSNLLFDLHENSTSAKPFNYLGVIIGVVLVAIILGGVFVYLRKKSDKE